MDGSGAGILGWPHRLPPQQSSHVGELNTCCCLAKWIDLSGLRGMGEGGKKQVPNLGCEKQLCRKGHILSTLSRT
jgi:hypothetical protein